MINPKPQANKPNIITTNANSGDMINPPTIPIAVNDDMIILLLLFIHVYLLLDVISIILFLLGHLLFHLEIAL